MAKLPKSSDAVLKPSAAPTDKFVQHGLRIPATNNTLGQISKTINAGLPAVNQLFTQKAKEFNKAEEVRADQVAAELALQNDQNISLIAQDKYGEVNSAVFNNRLAERTAVIASQQYQRSLLQSLADEPLDHNDPQAFSSRVRSKREEFLQGANPHFASQFLERIAPREDAAFGSYEARRASDLRQEAIQTTEEIFSQQFDSLSLPIDPSMRSAHRAEVLEGIRGSLQDLFAHGGATTPQQNAKSFVATLEAHVIATGDYDLVDELSDTRTFKNNTIGGTVVFQEMEARVNKVQRAGQEKLSKTQAEAVKAEVDEAKNTAIGHLLSGENVPPEIITKIGFANYDDTLKVFQSITDRTNDISLDNPETRQARFDFISKISTGSATSSDFVLAKQLQLFASDAELLTLMTSNRTNRDKKQAFLDIPQYTKFAAELDNAVTDSFSTSEQESIEFEGVQYDGDNARNKVHGLFLEDFSVRHAEALSANNEEPLSALQLREIGVESYNEVLSQVTVPGSDKNFLLEYGINQRNVEGSVESEALATPLPPNAASKAKYLDPNRIPLPMQESIAFGNLIPNKDRTIQNNLSSNLSNRDKILLGGTVPEWDPDFIARADEMVTEIKNHGTAPGMFRHLPPLVISKLPIDTQYFSSHQEIRRVHAEYYDTTLTHEERMETALGRFLVVHNMTDPSVPSAAHFLNAQTAGLNNVIAHAEEIRRQSGNRTNE